MFFPGTHVFFCSVSKMTGVTKSVLLNISGQNQITFNSNQTYYHLPHYHWKVERHNFTSTENEDTSRQSRIFTDIIQNTRVKLESNLGVEILWKDYCSECSKVSGFGPKCLEVTFKGVIS